MTLVPGGRLRAFAAALTRLLDEPDLHATLATASAAAGRALPDWMAIAARVAAVIDRVAAAHGSA